MFVRSVYASSNIVISTDRRTNAALYICHVMFMVVHFYPQHARCVNVSVTLWFARVAVLLAHARGITQQDMKPPWDCRRD